MRDPRRTEQLVQVYGLRKERAEAAVAGASARVEQARQQQQNLKRYMAEYAARPDEGTLTAGALANRCAFVAKLADACRFQGQVVDQQQQGLQREYERLQQRQTEQRRMEHLHQHACSEQAQAQRLREQRAQDEAAVTQWIASSD
ncbi:MAG: flagellar FliJ family protein [Abyssibacter sp.]|uniref:flagellar FliJ family protein n=1 Tax=Abyssibacter sp. TaxID=2320200 RepID=UPI00321BCCA9